MTRQEKNYKSEDYYIGNTESKTIEKHYFRFNGINVIVESTTNDSLVVKSSNVFYVCSKCGYAIAEDEKIPKDEKANKKIANKSFKVETTFSHESLFNSGLCDCHTLYKYGLHHVFNTDVAKITFDCDTSDYKTMISTLYALLYSFADELNIDRKDVKACLSLRITNFKRNYSIVIYDSVPGGAGHSRRLVTPDGGLLYKVFLAAIDKMKNCKCDPSCYYCLRSYENQKIHEQLDRKLAKNFLEKFVGKIEIFDDESFTKDQI